MIRPTIPYARADYQTVRPIIQIEQTGKRWKGIQLAGCCALFFGAFIAFLGGLAGFGFPIFAGIVIGVIGLGVVFYGSAGAWWNHG